MSTLKTQFDPKVIVPVYFFQQIKNIVSETIRSCGYGYAADARIIESRIIAGAENFDPAEYIRCVAFQSFFGQPGHRDYLGAVLALGIGRERIGDIRIRDDRAWVFCLPGVEPLLLSLDRVGRYTVRSSACPLPEVPEEEHRTESVTFTVQSLRLDAVTGGIFRMSRSAAAEQIRLGLVSLNYEICDKVDAPVREGDVISLRGKGKGSVKEIGGRSKKDRLFITAERRV